MSAFWTCESDEKKWMTPKSLQQKHVLKVKSVNLPESFILSYPFPHEFLPFICECVKNIWFGKILCFVAR